MNVFLKESIEFQPVAVELDGSPYTSFEVCIVLDSARPDGWSPAVVIDGQPGIMIQDLAIGLYHIYVKINSVPEVPVIKAGTVIVR